jgi:heme/copper-type cytochrome/quinol oxidase subunit 2
MKVCNCIRVAGWFAAVALGALPQPLRACAACFGKTDSALAQGMNWGIFSLLAVVLFVFSGIVAFFIYLARKSALASQAATAASLDPQSSPTKS